jgi:hypothetical protein
VRLLRDREYIRVVGRKDVPGHPSLYGTTKKYFYLNSTCQQHLGAPEAFGDRPGAFYQLKRSYTMRIDYPNPPAELSCEERVSVHAGHVRH